MRVRAVCLDVDDTLVDFGGAALAALEHVLVGPVDPALWHELTEHHYGRYLAGDVDFPTMQLDRLAGVHTATGRAVPAELVELDARRLVELRTRLRLFEDVGDCLAALRADGLALAVVSNSDGPHQRAKLAAAGLAEAFDAVVVSGEVGVAKPAPGIFLRACTALGVEPAEAVHVGDKLDTDARGGARRRAARGVAGPGGARRRAARPGAPGARAGRGGAAGAGPGRLSAAIGGRPRWCVTVLPGRRARPGSCRIGASVESHWGMV